jgi:inner membrane protein
LHRIHPLLAKIMVIALLTLLLAVYFSGLLQARAAGLAAGAVAGVCYSLLYLLVLSEEYALPFGALALFSLLAATMVATRKLDWYRVASTPRPGT